MRERPSSFEPDRRTFIKKGLLAAAGGLIAAGVYESIPNTYEKFPYKTGALEGHIFTKGTLPSDLTGLEGKAPAEAMISFQEKLEHLFQQKEKHVDKLDNPSRVFRHSAKVLSREYKSEAHEEIDFPTYEKNVELSIEDVKSNLDWNTVQESMGLNAEQAGVLKTMAGSISSRHLTAYAFTELMPGEDGALNKDLFEFLLKSAGSRYVYSIPSMYDDRLSFGPYQFTSGALMDMGKNSPVVGGASKINRALPKEKRIPGSVINLRGNDHHKAAFLFAIYNLARMIKQLGKKEFEVLKSTGMNNTTAITEFIATAHHLPTQAFASAKRWLANGAVKDFEVSCSPGIVAYARKTHKNLAALQALN